MSVAMARRRQKHFRPAGRCVGGDVWNYMGWDNASTIAQEVERPQRTYPKAMIAAVVLVSLTYILPFLAVYLRGFRLRHLGQMGLGRQSRGIDGWKDSGIRVAAFSDCHWWDDERVRDVQRAGDELLEASAGDGARRNAAEGLCEDDGENADAVGSDSGLRRMLGALFGLGIQEARYFGHYALWRELDAGVRDAGGFADSSRS